VGEEPGDPADEWGLIDVTPGWVLAAGEVIELVAEVAVAGAGEEIKNDADERDGDDDYGSGDDRSAGEAGCHDDRGGVCGHDSYYGLYNRLFQME
jgi:hypothetical protein